MKLWTALAFATLFCAAAAAQDTQANTATLPSVSLDAAKDMSVPPPTAPVISTDAAAGEQVVVSTEPEMTDEEDTEIDDPQEEESQSGINPDQPPVPVNLGGDGTINLKLQRTGEELSVKYRNDDGTYNQEALTQINHLMRCSMTSRETDMSIKLVELLNAIQDHFGKTQLIVLSGYRSPDLNKTIPWAAKNSRHMLGWASDIRIPGYTAKEVTQYALSLEVGGVGYYPGNGFTHVDVGRVRYWVGSSYRRHHRSHHRSPVRHGRKTSRKSARSAKHPAARNSSSKRSAVKHSSARNSPAKHSSAKTAKKYLHAKTSHAAKAKTAHSSASRHSPARKSSSTHKKKHRN
jgi:uncharacterized protein YcbK (DUF882 family)